MDFNLISQFSFFNPSTLWAIAQMIIGLGAVIFVHELGHFLVAKACGVKCEKFYLGFDAFDIKIADRVIIPRKLVHWKWGETEYGVGILPLGGYVKMLGQDDNPSQIAEERKRSLQDGEEVTPDEEPKLDPRSYQAKSVPQRMAIISAGVIMNLIFAIIFAAIAFLSGVNYEPPQIGATVPGSPAWTHDLDGASVVQIGDKSTKGRYFTFGHLREAIVFDGDSEPIDLVVLPAPTFEQMTNQPFDMSKAETVTHSITPTTNLIDVKGAGSLRAIGIGPTSKAVLVGENPAMEGQAAAEADPPLETNDRVLKVQGKSIVKSMLDENGKPYQQYNVHLLQKILSRNWDKPVEMVVGRIQDKSNPDDLMEVTTTLPPNPMRTIGLVMRIGKIEGIQKGSPAEKAGFKIGDLITQVDGKPIGDPMTLQQRMATIARENGTAEITVERGENGGTPTTEKLVVTPRLPRHGSNIQPNRPIAVDSLGIAFFVSNKVSEVNKQAPDSLKEIEPGFEINSIKFFPVDEQKDYFSSTVVDLNSFPKQWPIVDRIIQRLKMGTRVEVTYINDKREATTVSTSVEEYPGFFQETRGFNIALEQMPYQAKSAWEALKLGASQTYQDATKVVRFLGKLIRGDIPITGLGGPGTIVMAATSEASQGTSRLLLFLTLLSANLAVINFLPIPILDGGHMVFLAYEGIFRRPVSERLQIILSFGGLIFIVGLMLLVISLDIWRWSGLF